MTLKQMGSIRAGFDTNESAAGNIGIVARAIICANSHCLKATVDVAVAEASRRSDGRVVISGNSIPFIQRRLLPESGAKPQPDYIPQVIRDDYLEACRIKDLSPKAAATLCRRCLQGMIRDFAKISGRTLYDEITALKAEVEAGTAPQSISPESVDAIEHVRGVGNIGAHMEKDIGVIVPVDPNEAQILIELIESLFEEWYVRRHRRKALFNSVKTIASEKADLRKAKPIDGPESAGEQPDKL